MARYWVGGPGNISDTSHWSTTSGGAGGASVPDSTQDVFVDENSGLGGGSGDKVNVNASQTWKSLYFDTGTTSKWDRDSGGVTILGDVTFNNATINPGPSGINMNPTSGTSIFTKTNSDAISGSMNFNPASGATVKLGGTARFFGGLTKGDAGTFDTGNYNIQFGSGSTSGGYLQSSGTIVLGSSTVNVNVTISTGWNIDSGSVDGGTSTIKFNTSGGVARLGGGAGILTYNRLEFLNTMEIREPPATASYMYFEPGKTYSFETGDATNSFKADTLEAKGTSGSGITFQRIGASGTAFICAQSFLMDYVTVSNVNALCAAPYDEPAVNPNGTDGGGNTNWIFAHWFKGTQGAYAPNPRLKNPPRDIATPFYRPIPDKPILTSQAPINYSIKPKA